MSQTPEDEITPLPPSGAAMVAQAIRHCGDAIFAQSNSIRDLQRSVDEQRITDAGMAGKLDELIRNEAEERATLLQVLQVLSRQGVQVDTLVEDSKEFPLQKPEPEEQLHRAVGRWVIGFITHKVTLALTAAAALAAHALRSLHP